MGNLKKMRKQITVILMITGTAMIQVAYGQTWKLNEKESHIIFIAKNLGMKVSGKISGMKVTGNYNDENIFASTFVGSIDVSTIDTKITLRDNHLRSSDYFDVEKYPIILFKSKEIIRAGSALKVIGDLTIKGVTKETEVTFTVQKAGNKHTLVGNVTIQRKDYDLGSNTTVIMADTIQVRIIAVFEQA
jgi:polyisoprenoid-binding protein YceI